jgi:hypothetical protein
MDQKDYFYKPEPMPNVETMTPELLARIQKLVEDGATVLGHRPRKSPSLANFPECDRQVERLADAIWGKDAGERGSGERLAGKGRVIWGRSPEEVFAHMQVPPDFEPEPSLKGKLNYTHRRGDDGADIYFVVNQQAAFLDGVCNFRVSGRRPELWWPQSGRVAPTDAYEEGDGVTRIRLSLEANESVFVIFREPAVAAERISAIYKDSEQLWPSRKAPTPAAVDMDGSFTLAAWARPGPALELPEEVEGGWAYKNEVKAPGLGYETFSSSGQGRGGFSIGSESWFINLENPGRLNRCSSMWPRWPDLSWWGLSTEIKFQNYISTASS